MMAEASVTSTAIDDGAQDDVEVRRDEELARRSESVNSRLISPEKSSIEKKLCKQERQQRAEIDDAKPEQRRRQHEKQEDLRVAPEEVRQPA
jgi:hypothetical protein